MIESNYFVLLTPFTLVIVMLFILSFVNLLETGNYCDTIQSFIYIIYILFF